MSADRRVRRLRVRVPAGAPNAGAAAARAATRAARVEDALRTASVPGYDGARVLIVRRLRVGAGPAARAGAARQLEARLRAAAAGAVPALGTGAGGAGGVYFDDPLAPYVALAQRLGRGDAAGEWFWPAAVPGWRPGTPRDAALRRIVRHLAAQPGGAAALAGLYTAALGDAAPDAVLGALEVEDGVILLAHLGVGGSGAVEGTPHPPTLVASAEPRTHWAPLARWARAWGPEDARSRWLAAVRLLADRPALALLPAVLRAAAARAARDAAGGAAPGHGVTPAPGTAEPRAAGAGPTSSDGAGAASAAAVGGRPSAPPPVGAPVGTPGAGPSSPGGAPGRPPGARADGRAAPTRAPTADGGPGRPAPAGATTAAAAARVAAAPSSAAPNPHAPAARARGADGHPASQLPPGHDHPDTDAAPAAGEQPAPATAFAGVLFLVPLLNRLRLPDALATDAGLVERDWAVRLLRHAARRLGVAASDPVLAALPAAPAGVAAEDRGRTAAWVWRMRAWTRAHAGLSLRALAERPGRVAATRTHVDLLLDLAHAEVAVRRAGLDLDPGWVPWLGRVVRFHYAGAGAEAAR